MKHGKNRVLVTSLCMALAGLLAWAALSQNTASTQASPLFNPIDFDPNRPAHTTACGALTGDTTWYAADSPILVDCDVTVPAAYTLTIQPGVIVKFQGGEDELYVYGKLLAVGNASQQIVFTSLRDDAHGGDTNGDGSATSPAPGSWGAIRIAPDGDGSRIEYTWIGYGGAAPFANLELNTSQVSVHHNTIASSNGSGITLIGVASGVPFDLHDNTFISNATWPISANAAGMQTSIELANNSSTGSTYNGFGMAGLISNKVTYTSEADFPLVFDADVTIGTGAALTLTQGTVVKFQDYADELYVYGPLTAVGTISQPVVFTSIRDDLHGGDTNGDGTTTSPAPGDWGAIRIAPDGDGSRIEYTWIGYGGAGPYTNLELNTSQISVEDNTIVQANGNGVNLIGVAAGVPFELRNNDFISNTTYPIFAYPSGMQTSITLSGNTSQGSQINGLGMYGVIDAAVTYTTQSDFPLVFEGDVTIRVGGSLTLPAGSIIKFQDVADELYAYGRLTAVGTAEEPIIYTSLMDDVYGGDTNHDGALTSPGAGSWGNIRIYAGSPGSRLEHTRITYGGSDLWSQVLLADSSAVLRDSLVLESGANGVLVSNASPTIQHNLISASKNAGIYTNNNAQPVLRDNVIMLNGDFGVNNVSNGILVDAAQNYWGSPSGPYHPQSNPFGTGNRVSNWVLYVPWLESPPADLLLLDQVLVGVSGGTWFHPGETTHIQVFYLNLTDQAIQNAVLVTRLPLVATYGGSSEVAGSYWPARHEVFWKLGNLAPGEGGSFLITLKYLWGLPAEFHDGSSVLFAGSNYNTDLFAVQPYLDHVSVVVTGRQWLSAAEAETLRLNTPALQALYTQAISSGFVYATAAEYSFESGIPQTRLTLLHLANRAVRFLIVDGETVYATTFEGSRFSIANNAGGLDWNLETGVQTYSGAWAGPGSAATCSPQGGGCCLRNCLKDALGEAAIGRLSKLASAGFTARTCYEALNSGDIDKVADCGSELTDSIPIAGEVKAIVACVSQCAGDENSHDCTTGRMTCEKGLFYSFWAALEVDSYRQYYCENGCLTWSDQFLCALGDRCVEGQGCVACEREGVNCHNNSFNQAQDPNALYGPSGDLLAGQWVTYTIEYENMGEGAAEGVFVIDKLDEAFDDSTLTIQNDGEYFSGTRTLSWDIGHLAANGEVGSTGKVRFSVQLWTGLAAGTPVINQAVVHFPSVPEVTPTNLLAGQIATIAAEPQILAAQAGQPLEVLLSGRMAGGLGLTYTVVDGPQYGTLSGTPPSLVYTSMANFTGPDRFTFQVTAGGETSSPAEVLIQVGPWSGDTTPPTVLSTFPADGAAQIAVSAATVFTSTSGPVYGPAIQIQFDEAVDAATLVGAVTLTDNLGTPIPVLVGYEGMSYRVIVYLLAPLDSNRTYTVTVSEVADLVGNVQAEVYTWEFHTGQGQLHIYLPLIISR